MPSTIYEDTLTDAGSSVMGGTRALYAGWEVTVDGIAVRAGRESDPDALIGVGYFAFGNDLTPLGLITGVGWQPAVWFNWRIGQWIVTPTVVGGDFPALFAQYVKWALSPGTEVHFYVFGDS